MDVDILTASIFVTVLGGIILNVDVLMDFNLIIKISNVNAQTKIFVVRIFMNYECKEDEFLCENNNCILIYNKCNGHDDCGDNSDEKECPKSKILYFNYFYLTPKHHISFYKIYKYKYFPRFIIGM